MNKQTRTKLSALQERIEEIRSELETLRDEEQEKYDNMPPSLQDGDKGMALSQAIENIDLAMSDCESAKDSIEAAKE